MNYRKCSVRYLIPVLLLMVLISCHDQSRKDEKDIVKTPVQLDNNVGADLKMMLEHHGTEEVVRPISNRDKCFTGQDSSSSFLRQGWLSKWRLKTHATV